MRISRNYVMKGNLAQPLSPEPIGPANDSFPWPRKDFSIQAELAFRQFIMRPEFPCLGAKAALNASSYELRVYDRLAGDSTAALSADLYQFTRSELRRNNEYATFAAIFAEPTAMDEIRFEELLWLQLSLLHQEDAEHFQWDPSVRSDPADPQFSFSFAGQALYVIGMHGGSSREARRFPWPMLIFNPHEQFERLRSDGKWKKMQESIRARDYELQGSINPMLSDFGEQSEARQYSGRVVPDDWRAPFTPSESKCPFAH